MAPAKKRRPHFTESEMLQLVTEVEKRKDVIMAPVSAVQGITISRKDYAWDSVAAAVNSYTDCQMIRDNKELRKKFKSMKGDLKRKAASMATRSQKPGT